MEKSFDTAEPARQYELDSLDHPLVDQLADSFTEYVARSPIEGPAISIAYHLETFPRTHQVNDGEFFEMPFSSGSVLQRDIKQIGDILDAIDQRIIAKDPELDDKKLIVNATGFFENDKKPIHLFKKSLVAITTGLSKEFFGGYNDSTEAMYKMDAIGATILTDLLTKKIKPVWIGANYNFKGIYNENNGLPYSKILDL